jgi:hypothetical protein
MLPEELLTHDLLQSSPLLLGNITRPNKAPLVTELKTNLTPVDYKFNQDTPQITHALLDFMSKIRQFQNLLSAFSNIVEVIQGVFCNAHGVCPSFEMTPVTATMICQSQKVS